MAEGHRVLSGRSIVDLPGPVTLANPTQKQIEDALASMRVGLITDVTMTFVKEPDALAEKTVAPPAAAQAKRTA